MGRELIGNGEAQKEAVGAKPDGEERVFVWSSLNGHC